LPLVTIKDPLSWMASMCRSPYAAHFGRGAKAAAGEHGSTGLCPSPLPATATKVAWQPKRVYKYSSLPDLWNRWYREYVDASLPAVLVRYEDLLFDPERTVAPLCTCAGGRLRNGTFRTVEDAAKTRAAGHRTITDRSSALSKYGSERERYRRYSRVDLDFVRRAVDPELLRFFAYRVRPEGALNATSR